MAAGPDDSTQQLTVVPVAGEEVDHVHPGLDTRQSQHVRGMIQSVTFQVLCRAARVLDGCVVGICGADVCAGQSPSRRQHP